jgi:hypothetical protein
MIFSGAGTAARLGTRGRVGYFLFADDTAGGLAVNRQFEDNV